MPKAEAGTTCTRPEVVAVSCSNWWLRHSPATHLILIMVLRQEDHEKVTGYRVRVEADPSGTPATDVHDQLLRRSQAYQHHNYALPHAYNGDYTNGRRLELRNKGRHVKIQVRATPRSI